MKKFVYKTLLILIVISLVFSTFYIVAQAEDSAPGAPTPPEYVEITAEVPRRMSVRLQDGRIIKDGEKFLMVAESSIMFQMCANDWSTNTYADGLHGVAGTRVYSFSDTKKDDDVMRVDTNGYFMAVIFRFGLGDYNKQTGIPGVVNTPLEYLSVNLPLGSTITAFAFVKGAMVASVDLFIEQTDDKTSCVTEYVWAH